jgi:hypothetical protein
MARKTMTGWHGPGPNPDWMTAGRRVMRRNVGPQDRNVGREHGANNGTNKNEIMAQFRSNLAR